MNKYLILGQYFSYEGSEERRDLAVQLANSLAFENPGQTYFVVQLKESFNYTIKTTRDLERITYEP